MLKLRVALLLAFLLAVMIPISVMAAGTFYCSTLKSTGGDGSYQNPWPCSSDQEFDVVVFDYICNIYDDGSLYRIYANSYIFYRLEWRTENNARVCRIASSAEYPGAPPNTGVEFSMPLILGGVLLAGAVLLSAGFFLRRSSRLA